MEYFDQTWYDCALDRIKELTDGKENFIVYDVGAGNSVLEEEIRMLGGRITGFDYKPRKEGIIELNLERPIAAELTNGRPDIILLLEVIEHLFNPGLAVLNLAKMAKPGTHLILTTPNPYWSVIRLKFFFLNVFPMFEKSDLDNNHHVFTAWPHVIEKLLADNGFEVQHKFTIGQRAKFPRFSFDLRYPGKIIVYFLRKVLEKFSSSSAGMCFGIVAIKA
jgi:2-polyprenyl-3-methyl-5-hydroxy-6-metoxy-1,4-benzoquinol methylase